MKSSTCFVQNFKSEHNTDQRIEFISDISSVRFLLILNNFSKKKASKSKIEMNEISFKRRG